MTIRLKQFIFNTIYKELSNVEIISTNTSIWFIDREKKYWYLEYEKMGTLYWRWDFFTSFFSLFSLEMDEFNPIISEWVEDALNYEVKTMVHHRLSRLRKVAETLNYEVKITKWDEKFNYMVEEVLNDDLMSNLVDNGNR